MKTIEKRLSLFSAAALLLLGGCIHNAGAQVLESALLKNAPDTYTVKKGDTLWGISGRFLAAPAQWPAIWKMNRSAIVNPDLIYPGDQLALVRGPNGASLSIMRSGSLLSSVENNGVVRLSPKMRDEEDAMQAIPAIPYEAIGPFLRSGLVVSATELENAPIILATEEGRINLGAGGKAYASVPESINAIGKSFEIYHPGVEIVDPVTNEILGYEAVRVGAAHLTKAATASRPATIRIDSSVQEIGLGDKLQPVMTVTSTNFIPHPADPAIHGRVVKLRDNINTQSKKKVEDNEAQFETESGPLSIVLLSQGTAAGLEAGNVLTLRKASKVLNKRNTFGFDAGDRVKNIKTTLPEEDYGQVMVFRTFERVSYAIVLKTDLSVNVGDEFGASKE